MSFLFIDIDHFGAELAPADVASAVGFVKVDLEGWKFLSTIFADLKFLLFFHTKSIIISNINNLAWAGFVLWWVKLEFCFIIIVWTAIVTARKFGSVCTVIID